MTIREGDVWRPVEGFPSYLISVDGEVFNLRQKRIMRPSKTSAGHVKITLTDMMGDRHDRSVAKLVASAFVQPLDDMCNGVVLLDGDLANVCVENIVWRPRWYGFKYSRQLKVAQPVYFRNLPVRNRSTGQVFSSIIEAGMVEGLLFADIWHSIDTGDVIYPKGHIFEVVD